ncbi:hypothetical protein GN244_ATG15736 [Phytophthora infestans]|uniref:Uncharacterized protein n=1 Tax=Phytophthora infestans TaxID=4787 RepID=A0A833SEW5_PHYIN|nr:hypothetical protein GN244_ATG15736 [Phytophthora infestans]
MAATDTSTGTVVSIAIGSLTWSAGPARVADLIARIGSRSGADTELCSGGRASGLDRLTLSTGRGSTALISSNHTEVVGSCCSDTTDCGGNTGEATRVHRCVRKAMRLLTC